MFTVRRDGEINTNNYILKRTFCIWRWWDFSTTEVYAELAPLNVGPLNCVC
jgi:hypothetical protein